MGVALGDCKEQLGRAVSGGSGSCYRGDESVSETMSAESEVFFLWSGVATIISSFRQSLAGEENSYHSTTLSSMP